MDFKIKNGEQIRTVIASKASETVIEAGDVVGITAGLIVKAGNATTALAYAPNGAAAGETTVEVSVGNDFTLIGTADAAFAATDRGILCDLVMATNDQQIDIGTTSTNVFMVSPSVSAGVVGSASNVEVKINKPIF